MPVTPFHLGPGLFLKALFPRQVSFVAFTWSQFLIDLPVAYNIATGTVPLHGFSHTLLGATVYAIAAGLTAPLLARALRPLRAAFTLFPRRLTFGTSLLTAFVGTYSHLFFDGIMHHDMHPFAPLTQANPFYRLTSLLILHLICLASALIGACIWSASNPPRPAPPPV